eukprot:11139844-Lingulodinium_polyedra.AAC.1
MAPRRPRLTALRRCAPFCTAPGPPACPPGRRALLGLRRAVRTARRSREPPVVSRLPRCTTSR